MRSRAATGDAAGALADAQAACDSKWAFPESIGLAELARATVAANASQKDEVREILSRAAPFFDDLTPRDRELLAGLQAFAASAKPTIYRTASKFGDRSSVESWLGPADRARVRENDPPQLAELPRARTNARSVLVGWGVIVVAFLVIWLATNTRAAGRPPGEPTHFSVVLVPLFVVLFGYALLRRVAAARRAIVARLQAVIAATKGEPNGVATLEELARRGDAAAYLWLARRAEAACELAAALSLCEKGIHAANATTATQIASYDAVLPALAAERAFCLAALGRPLDDAPWPNAVNDASGSTHRFRVRLAQRLVGGDLAGALDVARHGEFIPLPRRDAMLISVLEGSDGATDEESAAIAAALQTDVALAKWVEHFLRGAPAGQRGDADATTSAARARFVNT